MQIGERTGDTRRPLNALNAAEVIDPALMKTQTDSIAIRPAVQELIQQALQPVNQQLEPAVAQKHTAAFTRETPGDATRLIQQQWREAFSTGCCS